MDNKITCKGSLSLGTACGRCSKCLNEAKQIFSQFSASNLPFLKPSDDRTEKSQAIYHYLRDKIEDLNEAIANAEANDVIVDLHIKKDPLKGIEANPILIARILQRI